MIGIIGINHETAPLEVREKLTFDEKECSLFLQKIIDNGSGIEVVLVSTCNRTELYFAGDESCSQSYGRKLIMSLLESRNLKSDLESSFYVYSNYGAVFHLLKVAAGLDSMVLGENQILGQLKTAYRMASEKSSTGTILNRLFHKAFEAGKKVRTETGINEGASSVGFAAVELAYKVFGELENNPVLLIGAGETGELLLKSLKTRGSRYIRVTNRTTARAVELANRFGAEVKDFEALETSLIEADIVITSTSAGKLLLDKEMVTRVMKARKKKMFLLIDLSVPRNIDEAVREINNTFLFNMDDLQKIVAYNGGKRRGAVKKAEIIIGKIADDFINWINNLQLSPTIESLRNKLFTYSENELNKLKNKISIDEFNCVNEYSDFITKKYLGLIIKNLKVLSKNGNNLEYIEFVNNLFELDPIKNADDLQSGISGEIIEI